MSPPDWRANLARLARLARKELSESLRDRRTVITLVLMPLLLYPLLAIAFGWMQQYRGGVEKEWPVFTIALPATKQGDKIVWTDEAKAVASYWLKGEQERLKRYGGDKASEKDPPTFLKAVPRLELKQAVDVEQAVRDGDADVGVRLEPPGEFRPGWRAPLALGGVIYYSEASKRSHDAVRHLELLTADANAWHATERFKVLNPGVREEGMRVRAVALADAAKQSSSWVPVLVPLVLILMTMTGAVYPAIDLTAGERERGTLEILAAAPIPRLSVLLAKYVAVYTVAMLTAVVNIASMGATLTVTGIGAAVFGSLGPLVLAQVLALLALFAAFFSAVLLAVTSFARSFKEAQSYLIPLVMFCLMPGILALLPGLTLDGPLAVVPLVNIVLLARDLLSGGANVGAAFVVVLSTLVYALAAVMLAARVFGTEAVLTGEHGTWADLFRRPKEARDAAEPAGALLCLAVLFPVYFLLQASLRWVSDWGPAGRLFLTALLTALLFGGFPLVAAWLGRLRRGPAFGLLRPAAAAWPTALLLGLCLWPIVHLAALPLLRLRGADAISPQQQELIKQWTEQIRTVSPALAVLALAVVPAVFEELFFRGYLQRALLGDGARPTRAVVASAALFAAFHGVLSLERLLPSLLLGLVVGWLAYRAGSTLPGMLLHAMHNASLVLMNHYQAELTGLGFHIPKADEALPLWLLATAGAGVAGGLFLVSRLRLPGVTASR